MKKNYYLLLLLCVLISACGGSGTSRSPDVSDTNNPPVAADDSYIIDADSVLTVLDNDNDANGDTLSISEVTQPNHGQVSITDGRLIQLTIDQDFVGSDQFTYTISDDKGASDSATVSLSLDPAQKRPVAVNDSVTGDKNETLNINVLLNDSDANQDALVISEVTAPANGNIEILTSDTLRYVPNVDFTGTDQFSYTVSDGALNANAQVNLVINDNSTTVPEAVEDVYQVVFETSTALSVLSNDSDPNGLDLEISDYQEAQYGSLNLAADRKSFSYLPDDNYVGPDNFIYFVTNGTQTSAATVTLNINTVTRNTAPNAQDDHFDTGVTTPISFSPYVNDNDADGDVLTLSVNPVTTNGVLSIDNQGTTNNFLDDQLTYTPNSGFVGTDVIVYEISDGIAVDRAVITIRVGDALVDRKVVAGSVHKGAVRNALISLYRTDSNGQAIKFDIYAAATSDDSGFFELLIPESEVGLLAVSTGGVFIDESGANINVEERRLVNLNDADILESYWVQDQTQLTINAYTSAIVRKARTESRQTFNLTLANNFTFSQQAFGFDPFSSKPSNPLNPQTNDSSVALQYALFLGGFSNVLNANSLRLGETILSSAVIDATVSDLSDCLIDGKNFGNEIRVSRPSGFQMLPDETDLNLEIRRFRNNNFELYGTTQAELNTESCQQDGTVADNVAPVISLVGGDVTVEAGSTYTDAGASAVDNVDGDISASIIITNSVNTAIPSVYTVTYDVSDAAGNAATQVTRTVEVADNTAPVITLTGVNPQLVEVGTAYAELGAIASDTFDGDITASIAIDATAIDVSVPNTYTVTYDVSDAAGNPAAQVTRTVVVQDTTLPVITLIGANPQVIEAGSTYTELGATASDTFDGDITASIAIDATAIDVSVPNTYTVTYDVSDAAGNPAAQVTRTVVVQDTTLPVITLIGANPQVIEAGSTYTELGATASDTLDGDITASIAIDATAIDVSVPNTYTVTYDVTDAAGNTAIQVVRTVTVEDTTAPVITLLGGDVTIEAGTTYTDAGATAIDSVDGDLTSSIVVTNSVNTAVPNVYTVTYDVTDATGNVATQVVRTVTVEDTTAPVITLVGGDVTIEAGSIYNDAGATAIDNIDGDITASVVTVDSAVNTSVLGNYTVTYDVSDAAGNAATQVTRMVEVVDTSPPVVTLNGPSAIYLADTVSLASVDQGVMAVDLFAVTVTSNIASLNTSTATAPGVPLILTYTATDANGLSSTINREINVVSDSALADSDADNVSDAIELLVGSNPLVTNTQVILADATATGDGSSIDWTNASTTLPIPILSSVDATDMSFVLIANGTYFDSFASFPITGDCDNIAIIGSMNPSTNIGQPAVLSLNTDNLPTAGLQFNPVTRGQALELSGCENVYVAYIKISGASGEATVNKGGAINAVSGTTLTLKNVHLTDNTAELFGAGINIENTGTSVTIEDSLIDQNVLSSANLDNFLGAGVNVGDGANAVITNTRISDNRLESSNADTVLLGAGVAVTDIGTTVQITDSVIENNTLVSTANGLSSGGGLSVRNNAITNVENTRILGNKIIGPDSAFTESGGGVFLNASELSIINSTITGNQTIEDGGGIAVFSSSTLNLNDSIINGNSADDGGGIAVEGANTDMINIINNLIVGNQANSGGGISQRGSAQIRISNNTLAYNESLGDGGGLFVAGGEINYYNNITENNKANDMDTEDTFLNPGVSLGVCSNNWRNRLATDARCTINFSTPISAIADRGYKLRPSGGVFTNLAIDSGRTSLLEAEVDGKTTDPLGTVEVPGSNPDLGFHYPAGTVTENGQNNDGTANSSMLIEQPASVNEMDAVLTIQPVYAGGTNIPKGNAIFFRIDSAPTGTSISAPLTTATTVIPNNFIPMLDNGDGTYSVRFNTGATAGDIVISVLSNYQPIVTTPETFTIAIN